MNDYKQKYSYQSLVIFFFIFSFIGWLWEGLFHLISAGSFVNRGVLNGPWLPIYGLGSVFILVGLRKFRTKPFISFLAIITSCAIIEYFTSYFLELIYHKKWWDYSEYMFNIDGRICLYGLLLFAVGGMFLIYYAAPILNRLINKINPRIVLIIITILVTIFTFDGVYSMKHPNTGKGITDYKIISYIKGEL